MSYSDIRGAIPPPALALTEADNHAAVCAVLKWAKRATGVTRDELTEICAQLGVDVVAAMAYAHQRRR